MTIISIRDQARIDIMSQSTPPGVTVQVKFPSDVTAWALRLTKVEAKILATTLLEYLKDF